MIKLIAGEVILKSLAEQRKRHIIKKVTQKNLSEVNKMKHECDGKSYSRPNVYGCGKCGKRFPTREALEADDTCGKKEEQE